MGPLTAVVPKCLLPMGRVPVLHRVLDEALASGAQSITVVLCSPTSHLVEEHLASVTGGESQWHGTPVQVNFAPPGSSPAAAARQVVSSHLQHLIMHADELCPPSVTRAVVKASSRFDTAVAALYDPSTAKSRLARLSTSIAGTEDGRLPDGHTGRRLVGRFAARGALLDGLLARSLTLADVVREAARLECLVVQWPGWYFDIGTQEAYSALWREAFLVEPTIEPAGRG